MKIKNFEKLLIEKIGKYHPENPKWISGIGNESYDFCMNCANKVVNELKTKRHIRDLNAVELDIEIDNGIDTNEIFVDGGFSSDYEGPIRCNMCGKQLSYSLNEAVVEQEIDNWEEYGIPEEIAIDEETAYELIKLIDYLEEYRSDIEHCKRIKKLIKEYGTH